MGRLEGVAWPAGHRALFAFGALVLALSGAGCAVPPRADRLLTNGLVYTADPELTVAEAIAIAGDRILAVGRAHELERFVGPSTDLIDLAGRMVLPGLHDMHLHPLGVVPPAVCDLRNEPLNLDALSGRVAECLRDYPAARGEWLMVLEWNASRQRAGRQFGTLRQALDAVSTEHLIYLHASGGHHGAVNSPALARAQTAGGETVGFDARTIKRYFAELKPLIAVDHHGEPTGMLSEGARAPIGRPRLYGGVLGMDAIAAMLPDIMGALAAAGITSAVEARTSPELLEILSEFAAAGGLTVRLRTALFIDPHVVDPDAPADALPAIISRLRALRERDEDGRLQADAIKIFADGVLDGSPATVPPLPPNGAVLMPYLRPRFATNDAGELAVVGYEDDDDAAASHGVLRHSPALLQQYVRMATEAGFNVHVHAIGDRAVRETVNAFEAAHESAKALGLSQSIAHVELAHADDQRRIGELGIAVVFTFAWAVPDAARDMAVIPFIDRVDPARGLYDPGHYYFQHAYPAAGILSHGGLLVGGSDAPVADRHPRPFVNIAAAVFREGPDGVLNATQRIGIHDAIAAYTINGARLMGHGDQLGTLEAGKLADLVVIDRDIVALAEAGARDALAATRVELTMVGGEVVFSTLATRSADAHQ